MGEAVAVIHADEVNRRFTADRGGAGAWLSEAALGGGGAGGPCPAILSAEVMASLLLPRAPGDPGHPDTREVEAPPEAEVLRHELGTAVELLASTREVLGSQLDLRGGERSSGGELAGCIKRIDAALQRWQAMLARRA